MLSSFITKLVGGETKYKKNILNFKLEVSLLEEKQNLKNICNGKTFGGFLETNFQLGVKKIWS